MDELALALAAGGGLGLVTATLLERFVPVMPSYVLLVCVGLLAAEGLWSLPFAVGATTIGGVAGSVPAYAFGRLLGEERARRRVFGLSRLCGLKEQRSAAWLEAMRTRQTSLVLWTQLVPTVRLIAPGFAGLLATPLPAYLAAVAAGSLLWNALFIGFGYHAAGWEAEPLTVAVVVTVALIASELAILFAIGHVRRLRWRCR